MKFTPDKAIETLKSPASKIQISAAMDQESQLRVFTEELDIDELNKEGYWQKLKDKMRTRSSKKFDRVFEFARYPLPAQQITDSILSDYFKVFDGKNRSFHVDGDRDISLLLKWINEENLEKWIEESAREVLRSKPCTFVVVDRDKNGRPYTLLVDSSRLIDAQLKDQTGACEYIAFIHSVKDGVTRVSFYDDETFYVFIKDENGEYSKESDAKHSLGYCPATAFIKNPANGKNYFKRRAAFTGSGSKLEDWTQFDIYRNYTDHYVPFPVTQSPVKSCPNPNCQDGTIIEDEVLDPSRPEVVTFKYYACDVCKQRDDSQIYPGTNIGIKVRTEKDQDDGRDIFKMIFPDTAAMDYVPKKLDDLEVEIRHKVVGINYMDSVNEAMNKMQLSGSFASMESVLLDTKGILDQVYKWIVTTVAGLMYKQMTVKVDANFGTEWYLVSEDDLQKRFDNAKKAGLPQEELLMIYLQLIDTKYKGNPNKVERQKILLQLDPLPFYTFSEITDLKDKNIIDAEIVSMKVNFVSFVARFENENISITQFGVKLPIENRIQKIKSVLKVYNKEAMAKLKKTEPVLNPAQVK